MIRGDSIATGSSAAQAAVRRIGASDPRFAVPDSPLQGGVQSIHTGLKPTEASQRLDPKFNGSDPTPSMLPAAVSIPIPHIPGAV